MVKFKIWNEVRDNLISAIDNIQDETAEIIVIPFADNDLPNPVLKPMVAVATAAGKNNLKAKILALPEPSKKTMTYHRIPLLDFYNVRVSYDRVTYMFLMTDGQDEDKKELAKKVLLPRWGKEFGNKNVFGFYVMLCDSAHDSQINDIIDRQEHLWKVESADVNINLVRLQSNAIFNARNDKYINLRIYGNAQGINFKATFPTSSKYKVSKVSKEGDDLLRVYISCKMDVHSLPASSFEHLSLTSTGCGKYDFLVTEKIAVKCESKPERSLKLSVR